MAVVKSFKCVRPVKELAEQVASLPYDVYDRKEAKAAVSGKPYAFLNIDNKKMSKSLGNFFTVRDISEKYDLQVLRFFMLSAHYRSPLNFSAELMEASKNSLERILTGVENLKDVQKKNNSSPITDAELSNLEMAKVLKDKFVAAMDDDFNTADAISAIFELIKLSNTSLNENSTTEYANGLLNIIEPLCDVLGIITERKTEILDSEIEDLIEQRTQARKNKDFALADKIRNDLLERGIVLEDTREGVKWKRS